MTFEYLDNGVACESGIDLYRRCGIAIDSDGDGLNNIEDNCPDENNPDQLDTDNDGIGDVCDNCPTMANADQLDVNNNRIGDVCETDHNDRQLHIEGGDLFLDQAKSGIILRSTSKCYKLQVTDSGEMTLNEVDCPAP